MRTHLCGELRQSDIGSTVSVAGWVNKRREHGEHLAFVDVRDYSGVIQCVVDNTVSVRQWAKVDRRVRGVGGSEVATGNVRFPLVIGIGGRWIVADERMCVDFFRSTFQWCRSVSDRRRNLRSYA